MPKYRVYLVASAETSVEVEAENGESAVEIALGGFMELPYASAFAGYDLGQWNTPSELYPQRSRPEEDYEEIP